jgi:DNA-binding XRE family transcriptional regulator
MGAAWSSQADAGDTMSRTEREPAIRLRPSAAWEQLARHNFSQNELARHLGISSGYLSQLITGKRSPSPRLRRKILTLLPGATFDQLFLIGGSGAEVASAIVRGKQA